MAAPSVAILGSSAAGLSWAIACAKVGLTVLLCDPDDHARERAEAFACKDNPDAAGKIAFQGDFASLADVPLLFDALEYEERAHLQITPTPVQSIATPYPDPLPGTDHSALRLVPFQPMSLRKLTEVTRFPQTPDAVVSAWQGLAAQIGRVPVELPLGSPSVGLRLLDCLHSAADAALLHGAVLWELDEAMVRYGFDLGFYEAQDLMGLDVAYVRRKARNAPSKIADRAVEEGRIGKKIGWGWYRYPGGGGAVIDPLIEDLIREEAWFAKVAQIDQGAEAWLRHILAELAQEVAKIRETRGVSDQDLSAILIYGLGYPAGKLSELGL